MNDDEVISAFPQTIGNMHYFGMTLRDYFAAKAMQAHLMDDVIVGESNTAAEWINKVAKCAYEMADAMLEARK